MQQLTPRGCLRVQCFIGPRMFACTSKQPPCAIWCRPIAAFCGVSWVHIDMSWMQHICMLTLPWQSGRILRTREQDKGAVEVLVYWSSYIFQPAQENFQSSRRILVPKEYLRSTTRVVVPKNKVE